MNRVPVHVVAGFLGAGKTTMLLDLVARSTERCAVVVNDFGEARIDGTLLGGKVAVQEIAGGCVCCTAPEALVPALLAILESIRPERIFVETTGLARPADALDTLARSTLAPRLELAPSIVVVDPRRLLGEAPLLLLEQLDAGDILVATHGDDAPPAATTAFRTYAETRFPPPLAAVQIARGSLDPALLELRGGRAPTPTRGRSVEGWEGLSAEWPPEVVFDLKRLKDLLAASRVERVKGLFRTDLGWMLVERAGGDVHLRASPLRARSAVDVIDREGAADLLSALDAARWVAPPPSAEARVVLVEPDGRSAELNRWALSALPGQVPDVSAVVEGRKGSAVLLSELLDLVHAAPSQRVVMVAADGMTTAPVPVSEVGVALIVHSLEGLALPENQGGPFRVLVPKGASACANVKGLVRLEIIE